MTLERASASRSFDGRMETWTHVSTATGTKMRFGIFLPPQANAGPVPALYCLAGLTCTDENFAVKAGAQCHAAAHGIALIFPDTSPRGEGVADDPAIDIGSGAGFYLTATEVPWAAHYDMAGYVTAELPALVEARFPIRPDRRGITGHSMGGHGALVSALRDPARFASVSAIAPIAHPAASAWGRRAFTRYLGTDEAGWAEWDASLLMARRPYPGPILVDQGGADPYLDNLRPASLREAAAGSGQALIWRDHAFYDHSYWFVQSVIADHIAHHARILRGDAGSEIGGRRR